MVRILIAVLLFLGLTTGQAPPATAASPILSEKETKLVALHDLCIRYATGKGVPLDFTEAAKWCVQAAVQGDANAQHNLGVLYGNGWGVPQDYTESLKWFRRAAEQGDADSQYSLGIAYDNGRGVSQDYTMAAKWYRKAADQGHSKAQYNLGFIYGKGQGVPQDYVMAHMWFNLASVGLAGEDRERAVKNRDLTEFLMTPSQIAEAQRLAREWRPKQPTAAKATDGRSAHNQPRK